MGSADSWHGGAIWRTDNLDDDEPIWIEVLSEDEILAALGNPGAWIQRVQASSLQPGLIFIAVPASKAGFVTNFFVGRSEDHGETWSWSDNLGPGRDRAVGFELSDHHVNRLWVGVGAPGGKSRILVSNDGGQTFSALHEFNTFWYPYDIYVPAEDNPDDQLMFAVVDEGGLNRSTDGGHSWEVTTLEDTPPASLNRVVGGYRSETKQLFYVHARCGGPWSFVHSTDGGSTWERRYTTAAWRSAVSEDLRSGYLLTAQSGRTNSAADPVAWLSQDGGYTWQDKTGDWYSVMGLPYHGAPGSCGGTASVTIIDANAPVKAIISEGSDDAGQDAATCSFSIGHNEIYFGQCDNGDEIVSGFRFQNIPISTPEEIQSAHIEFTVDGPYSNDILVAFRGEEVGNSDAFSDIRKPSDRQPLTGHTVEWNINSSDVWNFGEKRQSPDLTPIIKEIVKSPGWERGNAISIIVRNVASNGNHRRVFAFEREGSVHAARLVLSFGHSISGQVTDASEPLSGVIISEVGGRSATTNSDGNYILRGLASGTYNIAPSKSGYTFSPPSRTVTVPPDATGQDFVVESVSGYQVWGRVTDDYGNPISNVTISDNAGHTTTDDKGFYSVTGLTAGTYTITPSKPSYTFSPSSITVSVPPGVGGINFKAMFYCSVEEANLSDIGKAVFDVVGPQNFCQNKYEELIILPPGKAGFEKFADLAEKAEYEVDFVTMHWDRDEVPVLESPGFLFLTGINRLYHKINNPNNPPAHTVRVRILLGLEHYVATGGIDQRVYVLETLVDRLGVPLKDWIGISNDNPPNWLVEVAAYRESSRKRPISTQHSHVKMMIVDGKTAIVCGYNVEKSYLGENNPKHDLGIQVSGPIVQDALKVFDELWYDARGCSQYSGEDCLQEHEFITEPRGDIPHEPVVKSIYLPDGRPVNVFSLYRDTSDKASDKAITTAISSATTRVNLLQAMYHQVCLKRRICFIEPYSRAILEAVRKQVHVNLLTSANFEKDVADLLLLIEQKDPNALKYLSIRFFNGPLHTKALSIDGELLIVGSQNFYWGSFGENPVDLAEYNLAFDDHITAGEFDRYFSTQWSRAIERPINIWDTAVSLQDAISQAPAGALVLVSEGDYVETVTIDKPISLMGQGADRTIFSTGSAAETPVFRITSSDVKITEMSIAGVSGYGIELIDSSNNSLENIQINNIVFKNNDFGGVLIQGTIPGSPISYVLENNTFVGGKTGVTINVAERQDVSSTNLHNIYSGQVVTPVQILSADDGNVEYSYNLFYNCGTDTTCATNWHIGNLSPISSVHDNLFDIDPSFVNSAEANYHLSSNSPAVDAGKPEFFDGEIFDGDNDGTPRIDIGAFEYVPDSLFTSVGKSRDNLKTPETFTLLQNYPNPFNAMTKIRFGLPHALLVRIELFNMRGQLMSILLDAWKPAGFHTVILNAGQYASGLYLYRIKAGQFSEVKKMILIK